MGNEKKSVCHPRMKVVKPDGALLAFVTGHERRRLTSGLAPPLFSRRAPGNHGYPRLRLLSDE